MSYESTLTTNGELLRRERLNDDGISFKVRYMGCIQVKCPMKSLDFVNRSLVAQECINKIVEAHGIPTSLVESHHQEIIDNIGDKPILTESGLMADLIISSENLYMISSPNQTLIVSHLMPNVSFAFGGDYGDLNFVAYIAKNENDWRACYVVECTPELSQELISTIGQAFEIRYKQQFERLQMQGLKSKRTTDSKRSKKGTKMDKEYYNDLPGKLAPKTDLQTSQESKIPPIPPLPNVQQIHPFSSLPKVQTTEVKAVKDDHEYVNNVATKRIFDMRPFICENDEYNDLHTKLWYHGKISRKEAEKLICQDGDFLVRESIINPGQYILTGMQGDIKKHLLLVDPEGRIRTKEQVFENVSHLIFYHCENALPIISAESALLLCTPIHRKTRTI